MTLFEYGARQLCRLASALGIPEIEQPDLLEIFQPLASSWASRSADEVPRWSGVTDDCSPYEFSVAFSQAGPELRVLVEAQAEPACPSGYWEASRALSRRLARRFGADLSRLEAIESLFAPRGHVWFAALHGAVLWPRERPLFKVYLNPAARGPELAPKLVAAALARLGLGTAMAELQARMEPGDQLQFLALDLTPEADARVKIYVRHPGATPARLARAASDRGPEQAEEVDAFLLAIFGRRLERLPRPALTTYTFRAGDAAPSGVTTHVACYPSAGSDREITARLAGYFEARGLPARAYRRATASLGVTGALAAGRALRRTGEALGAPAEASAHRREQGLHNYVSLQHEGGRPRITTYLCPRVYLPRLGAIGFDPVVAWPSPVATTPGSAL